MRKNVQYILVIIAQSLMLFFAIVWFVRSRETEALIAIISFSTTIIITLFFKFRKSNGSSKWKFFKTRIKGDKNTVIQDIKDSNISIKN